MKKEKPTYRVKVRLQHRLNPLHVYCRLIPILGKNKAMSFANVYESYYKRVL